MHDNKKPRGKLRRGDSIDGIIGNNRRLDTSVVPARAKPGTASASLGSLITSDEGFHPMRSSSGSIGQDSIEQDEADLLDEPIVLDDEAPPREKDKDKEKRHPRLRKYLKRVGIALLSLILLGGIYFGYKFYKTSRHVLAGGGSAPAVCDGNVPVNTLRTEGDGRVNILVLGIGGDGHEAPDLTDTIMLASLDPVNDKLDLLSIPRDLFVQIPGSGSDKINAAYEDGKNGSTAKADNDKKRAGVKLADQVVSNVLGVPVHYNALVDFKAFEDAVNALGGVDANVPQNLVAYENFWIEGTSQHYILDVKAGANHFDGRRALYFARERHNDSDFVRGQRQRLLIAAVKDKAFSVGTLTNPIKISNLLNSLGNNVYTDFDTGSIKCLGTQISQVPSSSISSLDLVTPPNVLLRSSAYSGSTQSPEAGKYDYSQIHNYVRTTLRDSFLAKENSSVAVYNATSTAGLATSEANILKSYGYYVTTVDNAPNQLNPATTTVVDLSGGSDKYTRNYLQQRFKLSVQASLPSQYGLSVPQGTKFVIILGKDAASNN